MNTVTIIEILLDLTKTIKQIDHQLYHTFKLYNIVINVSFLVFFTSITSKYILNSLTSDRGYCYLTSRYYVAPYLVDNI